MPKLGDTPIGTLMYQALAWLLVAGSVLNLLGYAEDASVLRGTTLGVALLLAAAARRKN